MANVKNLEFRETPIASHYVAVIKERWSMDYPENRVAELYRVIFNSIATMLKVNRNKNNPRIGFKLLNDAGEFRLGAILEYQKAEESEEDTGNWVLSFTFYEEDMKDLNDCKDNMFDSFFTIADHEMYSTTCGHFVDGEVITDMFSAAIESLKSQLSDIADSGEEVVITLPGVFEASVGFEEGQKVYAIVPGHNIKQLIKDDKGLAR